MTRFTIESTGFSDAKRVMDGEELIGMAMKYTSGFWAPHDPVFDKQLEKPRFATPAQVRKWFEWYTP